MSRIEKLDRSALSSEQAEVYDHIAGGQRAEGPRLFDLVDEHGRLNGPFNAMLVAPAVGDALQALGAAVRYETELSGRVREMAILAVATRWECEFETCAHEAVGRAAGLSEPEIVDLRIPGGLVPTDPLEAAALRVVELLLADGDLDDVAWTAAREHLTEAQMVELMVLVGYYATLALMLRVLRVPVPR